MGTRSCTRSIPLTVCWLALACSPAAFAGDLCFDSTPYPVGFYPSDVAMADFDGDGDLDLVAANHDPFEDNTVSVLLNNGDGTFAPSVFYAAGTRPYWIATADFDADGDVDFAVTNYWGHTISVFLNAGDGTFAPQVQYDTGAFPTFIAAGDLNGDGMPDLVCGNEQSVSVSVLLNDGDGTFAAQTEFTVGLRPYGIAVADYDGDGHADVAVSNYGDGEFNTPIGVLLNDGLGNLAPQQTYPAGIAAVGVTAVDVDNDGAIDLVAANEGYRAENNTISVLRNNGDGTFAAQVEYEVTQGPYDIATADFNADGYADLACGTEAGFVSILMNNGDGTFAPFQAAPIPSGGLGVAAGDLDGNGTPELAAACYSSNDVAVLFNQFVGITSQPLDVSATEGDPVSFTIAAAGPGELTYQWRKDGENLRDGAGVSGSTSDTLQIAAAAPGDAGLYDAIVTNDCGSLASDAATLTVAAKRTCAADFDGNGVVDGDDLGTLLGMWGMWGATGPADFNDDGIVDGDDLGTLLGMWGPC